MHELSLWGWSLIPPVLTAAEWLMLVALSFVTSWLTASVGIGGGTVLLAVMAQVMPIKALIPVHGMVQLGSNVGRASALLSHIQKSHALWFFLGSIVGAVVGGHVAVTLPKTVLSLLLGLFILYSTWQNTVKAKLALRPQRAESSQLNTPELNVKRLAFSGALSTLLTMFVGATGPFVLTSLRVFKLKPFELVATSAACMSIQHVLKVLIFGWLGFAFAEYLGLISAMMITGFIGTLIGRAMLLNVNARTFQRTLDVVLTLLAAKLIHSGPNQRKRVIRTKKNANTSPLTENSCWLLKRYVHCHKLSQYRYRYQVSR